jgi:predicted nucleic acid-binding Zn ribbon protein
VPLFDFECPNCGAVIEILTNGNQTYKCEMCDIELKKKFPFTKALRLGDSFIVGREKTSKEVAERLEYIKANPESDPYSRWRNE